MTKKAKFIWFVIFVFSVIEMTLGILDILNHRYSLAMLKIGISLMFFSDLFDLDFFNQSINFKGYFTAKKFKPFAITSMIYYLGFGLFIVGIISSALS